MGAPGGRHWDLKIVLLSAALLLSIGGNLLWLSERMKKEEWKHTYPLLSPVLRTVGKNTGDPPIRSLPLDDLKHDLEAAVDKIIREERLEDSSAAPRVGIYLEDLMTGAWMGINERQHFAPLSLLKVPMAVTAMRKVDKGEWTPDQSFTV